MQAKNRHFNDIAVGKKIRFRRNIVGLSQKQLGDHLGVTFQQIKKYEKGIKPVGAGLLQEIAEILDVPLSFFYADISTKKDALYNYDERIASKTEYLLLNGFRSLASGKQRAILRLIFD
ncbi:helix-turn-helix domain-containing protein [Bartonella taylorii]|uniref:helix-turn-helix domain-containing protein n=1 Tax=Bartonella taylorii TaxID=33046 RepID=UPI001ABA8282|nr:helix-turn-helix transcriptional regulator [Bartonella taylorii]